MVKMPIGGESNQFDIDEDLYSRQLAVYGRETMGRLFASKILVSGMQGLGAEIAKNLILSGVKSVTLHDTGAVERWDLSSSFTFTEKDIGKNRAVASIEKMKGLNNSVVISTLTTDLTTEQLSNFQVVVFTDISLKKAIEFDNFCHTHDPQIAFIKSEVRGLFGSVFCDFGPEFTVSDLDGEDPHKGIITYIDRDNNPLVSCIDDETLKFQDGDLVVFSEVHGMSELNDKIPRKVINSKPHSFRIEQDTTNFGTYQKGGIVTQFKKSKLLNFKPLCEALKDPGEFLLSDSSKFDRPLLLHLLFRALDELVVGLKRYPVAGCENDVGKFVEVVTRMNNELGERKFEDIDEKIVRNFAFGARAVLNPMAAMFGGIVAQEVVKACSGKLHPLLQFFYFDSLESLPVDPVDPSDLKPLGTRYDAQISVFGNKLQKQLEKAEVFVVGSGALGCEFLKNLALMGVSCGNEGKLTIADDHVIEKSDLSSQFLFLDRNIGQPKSIVAATAASSINPSFRCEAHQCRVGPDTEFADTYWKKLSAVVSALDDVNARLYIDQRCLYFKRPLLESRILGAKCNTQMVIPNLTEKYGAPRDPPEKQPSVCEVESFPHNIDHCLTWARSEFEELFEKTPAEANAYIDNIEIYTKKKRKDGDPPAIETLERLLEYLKERCTSFEDCIAWARRKFEDYFVNRVNQLTFNFPADFPSVRRPFWSAPKRFPRPLRFSVEDQSHLNFVIAASVLRAETYDIPIPDRDDLSRACTAAVDSNVPVYKPKKDVKIVTDPKSRWKKRIPAMNDSFIIDDLLDQLKECRVELPASFRMKSIKFEKGDNSNYHMDLIAVLANLRASVYSIPEVDKPKAKFLVGRTIPAIATAAAMATGLVCLELYKVLHGGHKVEDYRNTFANLAGPLFTMVEPVPAKVTKHQNMSWTGWDRWSFSLDPTVRTVLEWLEEKGLTLTSINFRDCLLYNSDFKKHEDRMDRSLVSLAIECAKDLPSNIRHVDLEVACADEEGNDVDIPRVSIYMD